METEFKKKMLLWLRKRYLKIHGTLFPTALPGPTNVPSFTDVLHFIEQDIVIVGPYPTIKPHCDQNFEVHVLAHDEYAIFCTPISKKKLTGHGATELLYKPSCDLPTTMAISALAGFEPYLPDRFRSHKIAVNDLSVGWNFIEIHTRDNERSFPVLRPFLQRNEVLFVESTDTALAYGIDLLPDDFEPDTFKGFDIPSYYHRNPTFNFFRAGRYPLQFRKPDLEKPYPKDHLIAADHFLKRLVARATDCEPDFAGDDYADDFENIRNYKMIVLGAHNEYWTDTKFRNLSRFVGEGGKLLVLGGNTAWRRVVRTDRGTFIYGNGYFYEKGAHDLLGSSLGGQEDHGFRNLRPSHHIMKDVPREFARVATVSTGHSFPTNGHETDRISSAEFDLLAAGPKDQGAHLVYRRFDSGGEVLKFGAVSLWLAYEDKGLEQVVRNFFTESL